MVLTSHLYVVLQCFNSILGDLTKLFYFKKPPRADFMVKEK